MTRDCQCGQSRILQLLQADGRIGLPHSCKLHSVGNENNFIEAGTAGLNQPTEVRPPQQRGFPSSRDDGSLRSVVMGLVNPLPDASPVWECLLLLS
jgi:hypothetical protein